MKLVESEPPRSWRYWRDKKGIEEALTVYYPKTLAANPDLQHALFNLRSAERDINHMMADLEAKAEGEIE